MVTSILASKVTKLSINRTVRHVFKYMQNLFRGFAPLLYTLFITVFIHSEFEYSSHSNNIYNYLCIWLHLIPLFNHDEIAEQTILSEQSVGQDKCMPQILHHPRIQNSDRVEFNDNIFCSPSQLGNCESFRFLNSGRSLQLIRDEEEDWN